MIIFMSKRPAQILKKVKILCQPLLEHRPFTKIIYVFGSITRGDFKKGSDIDVLIVFDDTRQGADAALPRIESEIQKIQEKANKKKLNLSFQKLMPLSTWWDLVRDGEPWVVSSLESPWIIYDNTGYVKLVSGLVNKGHVYNRAEKSEKLMERTYSYEVRNRELMLSALAELFFAGIEAAEIFLLSRGRVVFEPKKMAAELERLGIRKADAFRDIADLMEKANKGVLSEFTGENVDHYQEKLREFIGEIEDSIIKK